LSIAPDGIYLVGMRLTSTQAGLSASDLYQFLLYKNSAAGLVLDAVNALGVSASGVQFADVPEPATVGLLVLATFWLWRARWAGAKRGTA
jgi:hypothetical protein